MVAGRTRGQTDGRTHGRGDGLPSCTQKRREREKFGEFFFLLSPELSVSFEPKEEEEEEEFESVLAAHIRVRACQECQGAAATQDEPGPPATEGVKAGSSGRAEPSRAGLSFPSGPSHWVGARGETRVPSKSGAN